MTKRSSGKKDSTRNARRDALQRIGVGAAVLAGLRVRPARAAAETPSIPARTNVRTASPTAALPAAARRAIPSSGVPVPCIGMGTWLTFDLAPGRPGTDARIDVLQAFLDAGGGLIDSSPMYGEAEAMIGHALGRTTHAADALFAASKIWTPLGVMAEGQMSNTESLWGVHPMDLMQVHNLLAVDSHLPRLRDWRRDGRIGHVGLTTSHGRRHDELETLMRREPLDTVQLTLNLTHRAVEERLLPIAADRGVAVIVNRPLDGGALPRALASRPLSPLAIELGCRSWAQYALLFVVSHPAITCAIPATTQVDHLRENMAVMTLPMPDAATREAMVRDIG